MCVRVCVMCVAGLGAVTPWSTVADLALQLDIKCMFRLTVSLSSQHNVTAVSQPQITHSLSPFVFQRRSTVVEFVDI